MLSIIKERLDNADKYEEEHSKHYYDYDKIGFDPSTWDSKKYSPARRRIMNRSTNCKHKRIPEESKINYTLIMIRLTIVESGLN